MWSGKIGSWAARGDERIRRGEFVQLWWNWKGAMESGGRVVRSIAMELKMGDRSEDEIAIIIAVYDM